MELKTRLASHFDVGSIVEIYNQAVANRTSTLDSFPVSATRYESFFGPNRRSRIILAIGLGKPVGWASVSPINDRWACRFTAIGSCFVCQDFHDMGIEDVLTAAQIDEALKLGYHSLIVEVLNTTPDSASTYINQGFDIIGEISDAGFRDGHWIGLTIMQKMLQEDPMIERRVCFSVLTNDLSRSIALYRDALGLDMRAFSNAILMFPLGTSEFQVCLKSHTKELLDFEFDNNHTQGVLISLRFDSEAQMNEAAEAALAVGASLVGQSGNTSWSLEDFNGVSWFLDSLMFGGCDRSVDPSHLRSPDRSWSRLLRRGRECMPSGIRRMAACAQ